jgi:hypothetical protein
MDAAQYVDIPIFSMSNTHIYAKCVSNGSPHYAEWSASIDERANRLRFGTEAEPE